MQEMAGTNPKLIYIYIYINFGLVPAISCMDMVLLLYYRVNLQSLWKKQLQIATIWTVTVCDVITVVATS